MNKKYSSKNTHPWRLHLKRLDKKTTLVIGLCLALILCVWTVRLNNIRVHGYDYQDFAPDRSQAYFSSDLVAQQTILHNWQIGFLQGATTGDDTWLIKWPLYILTNNLTVSPQVRHLINTLMVLWVTAIGLFCVATYLIYQLFGSTKRRWFAMGVTAVFLASLPDITFEFLRWPNSRNVELPIFLGLLIVLFLSEHKKWFSKRSWQKVVGIIVTSGLLFVDDPLMMYMTVLPLLLLLSLRYVLGGEGLVKTLKGGGLLAASVVVMYALRLALFALTPLRVYKHLPAPFDLAGIISSTGAVMASSLKVIGISFSTQGLPLAEKLYILFSIGLAISAVIGIIISLKKQPRSLFYQYLAIIFVWNCVVVASLGPSVLQDAGNSRYLIVFPIIELVGLILLIAHIRLKRQFIALGLLLGLLLATTTLLVSKTFSQPVVSSQDYQQIITLVEGYGLKKGYADYGEANVNTFLSNYKTEFLSSVCVTSAQGQNELDYYNLLSEEGVKQTMKASKSFYLYFVGADACDPLIIEKQLGVPSKVINFSLGYSGRQARLAIYNYDISPRLPNQIQH